MALPNSKEEKKRKRLAEVEVGVQESSVQSTKKIKREQKSDGIAPAKSAVHGKSQSAKTEVEAPEAAAPQEDEQVQVDTETLRRQLDKQKSKDKKKRTKEERRAAKDGATSETASADVEVEAQVIPKINGAVVDEPTIEHVEQLPEPKPVRMMGRQAERTFTREELIDMFRKVEEAKSQGLDVDRKLHMVLKNTRKYKADNNPGEDDELVKLYDTHKNDSGSLWRVSQPTGGRHLDLDPVFSADENYIILATANSIHVYEAENSLLVRRIRAFGTTCYALSPSQPQHLYVGTQHGDVSLYDWTTGRWLSTVKAGKGSGIRALYAARLGDQDDALYTIEKQPEPTQNGTQKEGTKAKRRHVLVLRKASAGGVEDSSHRLHEIGGHIQHINVLDNRNTIVLAGEQQLIVGSLADGSTTTDAQVTGNDLNTSYRWRKLTTTQSITCIDTFSRHVTIRLPSGEIQKRNSHAIALGTANGEVMLYDDVVQELEKLEAARHGRPLLPRILRWHREAPNTVKWSKDGNYVISGGNETVLCLWQLETGQRQDLPHLTAAIRNLTVSPSGTSYGINLRDNSLMVLSTAELEPKTLIAGPQSLCVENAPFRVDGLWNQVMPLYKAVPMINHPLDAKDLLLAVSSEQQVGYKTQRSPSAPFLQTYNIQAGRHVSRQALTRNLVTEANIDADGNKLEVPDVTHMQISCDGMWLATIEDWLPPVRDVNHLATSKLQAEVERRKRRETYLKIWRWDEASKQWSLNTRFAQPHADDVDEQINRTFDLVASPTISRFATLGEDNTIRSWRPRTRGGVTTWDVEHVITLGKNTMIAEEGMDFTLPTAPTTGRLAYSNDGSVLAVCLQDDGPRSNSLVHFCNTRTGRTRISENGLTSGKLVALGFLDRYLILLSDELRVWDTVIGTMVFSRQIGSSNMNFDHRVATHHLAVSPRTQTFAVAGVGITDEHAGSSILIFKPTDVTPVFPFMQHGGAVCAITALSDGTGFLVLDSQAEIRTLTTHVVALAERLSKSVPKSAAMDSEVVIDIIGDAEDAETGAEKTNKTLAIEDERAIVKSAELGKVFADGGAGVGGMGVRDMFDGVARLFAVRSA